MLSGGPLAQPPPLKRPHYLLDEQSLRRTLQPAPVLALALVPAGPLRGLSRGGIALPDIQHTAGFQRGFKVLVVVHKLRNRGVVQWVCACEEGKAFGIVGACTSPP